VGFYVKKKRGELNKEGKLEIELEIFEKNRVEFVCLSFVRMMDI